MEKRTLRQVQREILELEKQLNLLPEYKEVKRLYKEASLLQRTEQYQYEDMIWNHKPTVKRLRQEYLKGFLRTL
jgi:hypothetical protein